MTENHAAAAKSELSDGLNELAVMAIRHIFDQAKKNSQQNSNGTVEEHLWLDDGVKKESLIPLGDAIIGYSTYKSLVATSSDLQIMPAELLAKTAEKFLALAAFDATNARNHGSPYLTRNHINEGENTNVMLFAIWPYILSCTTYLLRNSEIWGINDKASVKNLNRSALEAVCQHKDTGWTSIVSSHVSENTASKGELFPTFLASQSLRCFIDNSDQDKDNSEQDNKNAVLALEKCKEWFVKCLTVNASKKEGSYIWREFGTSGRARLIDQIMGLLGLRYSYPECFKINENISEDELMLMDKKEINELKERLMIRRALDICLSRLARVRELEPDYHTIKSDHLVGAVPWEDYSALFWAIELLLELKDVKKHDPIYRSSLNLLINVVTNSKGEDDQKPFWPAEGRRVYASWLAALSLLKYARVSEEIEPEISDRLYYAMVGTLTDDAFILNFAKQATNNLVKAVFKEKGAGS